MAVEEHRLGSSSSSSSSDDLSSEDGGNSSSCNRVVLFEWDYGTELASLLDKEKQQMHLKNQKDFDSPVSSLVRCEAVEWILRVNARHCFSPLTAILAVHYFDKFISSTHFHGDEKPWLAQLVAITCISLAAKMEETQVPLLLDFQVEGTGYVFEEKTIQRMELLVLSALQWKMNPVTPLAFLEHIVQRIGSKNLQSYFLRRGELLLMFIAADPRYARYLPSVLAAATMMHVLEGMEPGSHRAVYHSQLLALLKNISMEEEVSECHEEFIKKPDMEARIRSKKRSYGCRRENGWGSGSGSWPVLSANKRIKAHEHHSMKGVLAMNVADMRAKEENKSYCN